MLQILFIIIGSNLRLIKACSRIFKNYLFIEKNYESKCKLIAIISIKTCLINNFKIKNYLNIFKNSLVSD